MNVLLEPLKYYEQTAKHAHEQNLKEYFNSLVKSSAINVAENRKTAALFRKKDKIAENTKNKINKLKGWRVFLIILSVLVGSYVVGLILRWVAATYLVVEVEELKEESESETDENGEKVEGDGNDEVTAKQSAEDV